MWLLLFVPVLILVVLVLSVSALFAGVFWVLGAGWPVLLIALGAWMFWHEDGRHARQGRWGRGHRAAKMWPAADQRQQSTQQPKDKRSPGAIDTRSLRPAELPIDVQVKVEQIRRKVDVLLSYADRFPPFSQDLYLVRQTASDYLPRTISAYLALPKQTVEKPLSAGMTAYQELKAQLNLLDSKLDDIAQDLQRQDTDRLLANRRFLEDRFGLREGKPILEPSPGASPAA
jgi:ABC-type nickel/cobalt efflux system permease component RcnA